MQASNKLLKFIISRKLLRVHVLNSKFERHLRNFQRPLFPVTGNIWNCHYQYHDFYRMSHRVNSSALRFTIFIRIANRFVSFKKVGISMHSPHPTPIIHRCIQYSTQRIIFVNLWLVRLNSCLMMTELRSKFNVGDNTVNDSSLYGSDVLNRI